MTQAVAVRTSYVSTNHLEVFMLFFCGKVSQSEVEIVRTIQVSMHHHVLIKSTTEYLFPTNRTGK